MAVIDDAPLTARSPTGDSFYDSTRTSLRLLMLFLALAIDLGAGIAVHRALAVRISSGEDQQHLLEELAEVQRQIAATVFEITALTNTPAIFVATFWRDFYRAMLTQTTRKAIEKWMGLFFCVCILGTTCVSAQRRVDVVAAIDLSASEAVKGTDGKSQFDKNVRGVERLLGSLDANSRIIVIGITSSSFSDPYVLLRADISPDRGYFGERLTAARGQLLRAWQERTLRLSPAARATDILGAIRLAREFFNQESSNADKRLVLYSDMRHVTRELNLERPRMVPVNSALTIVGKKGLYTDLNHVTVYVAGANAAEGRQIEEWESLRCFWKMYFERTGATVGAYSVLWGPPK